MSRYDRVAPAREKMGFILGFLGIAGFSATLPATRLAVAHLDPTLVGLGRSVVAGVLALLLLLFLRPPRPSTRQFKSILIVSGGVIVGFPLLSAWAMQRLPASHGAIVVAVLPMFTAVAGALRGRERPSAGFWLASIAGAFTVVVYATLSNSAGLRLADAALVAAALVGALGYAEGGRLAKEIGGWQVICWALVTTAPLLLLPVAMAVHRHGLHAPLSAWLGFAYVSVISQFLAFFLWYQGLAVGGVIRVSQVQLLQPFLTMAIAALVLNEAVTPLTAAFAAIVVAIVAVGRRTRIAPGANTPLTAQADHGAAPK